MFALALLWVLAAAGDSVAYANILFLNRRSRVWVVGLALAISLATSIVLSTVAWTIWLAPTLLGLYRALNSVRFMAGRLPARQLNTVSLRAHSWLLSMQLLIFGGTALVHELHIENKLLPLLATIQLLSALLLLRASLHTWRHTEPFVPPAPLSDKDLPSLSVLVPARNETDALQWCLERLTASDYPKLEILVLDDNSTIRRTPEIIRSFAHNGVRFIQGAEPDETNWLPKNHAYHRLRSEASGALLLFCGVDALFEPGSLRALVEVLLDRQKDMLSILPLKDSSVHTRASLLQPMRYYWEICLPRRFFKRPPVLSTCWLIRADTLDHAGGFEAVSRSVTPEAYFARQAVVNDAYGFIRSNQALGISSAKPVSEQYDTSIRMRYPQLHRRMELVAVTTLLELFLLIGPVVSLFFAGFLRRAMAYAALWIVCTACLLVTYYLVAVATKLNNPLLAWALMPVAFLYDIFILHTSLLKYEFGRVQWKGRNVTKPVMQTGTLPHVS